ncbi:hypothetical protein BD770DRAFT_472295 [Pilaira anomala]|nr:hypothetical protein BD770DRAFT_472295 [Pilaira anomala]
MSKNDPIPGRYYTPQHKMINDEHARVFEPTPRPESVYINENSRVPRDESCCCACILACLLCFALKGEANQKATSS